MKLLIYDPRSASRAPGKPLVATVCFLSAHRTMEIVIAWFVEVVARPLRHVPNKFSVSRSPGHEYAIIHIVTRFRTDTYGGIGEVTSTSRYMGCAGVAFFSPLAEPVLLFSIVRPDGETMQFAFIPRFFNVTSEVLAILTADNFLTHRTKWDDVVTLVLHIAVFVDMFAHKSFLSLVRPVGIEPTTFGLKVRYSAN